MASSATTTSALDKDFASAQKLFLDSLPASERALFFSCNSAEELLVEVKKLSRFKLEKSRWKRSFECIKRFSGNLQPYFTVINIFVSSHPEWCAIAWGAVRLLLQVGCHIACPLEMKMANGIDLDPSWQTTSPAFSIS